MGEFLGRETELKSISSFFTQAKACRADLWTQENRKNGASETGFEEF